jgi:hypothetical protein
MALNVRIVREGRWAPDRSRRTSTAAPLTVRSVNVKAGEIIREGRRGPVINPTVCHGQGPLYDQIKATGKLANARFAQYRPAVMARQQSEMDRTPTNAMDCACVKKTVTCPLGSRQALPCDASSLPALASLNEERVLDQIIVVSFAWSSHSHSPLAADDSQLASN